MKTIQLKSDLRQQISRWRSDGDCIALVPTMGNLHDGHLSLVRIARSLADRIVVTIFVNPTQFGEDEDFDEYPQSLQQDEDKLTDEGVDLMFAPNVAEIYPFGIESATRVSVPGLTDEFCGAGRPGHFDGVATVVLRLFALVQPDIAIFGQKDYQQQLVIRRMTADFGLPIEIVTGPVVREPSGLAMSSRNAYLTTNEKQIAATLFAVLQDVGERLRNRQRNFGDLEAEALAELNNAGLQPEYFSIRDSADLDRPSAACEEFVVLAAARLGTVRLIDNIVVAAS